MCIPQAPTLGSANALILRWRASRQASSQIYGTEIDQFVITIPADYIWGVLDLIPDTDFPDIRNRCAIHSHNGSCMIIPREGDKVRLYIQLADKDVVDASTGRVDKSKMGPQKMLEVARKTLYPYTISTSHEIDWWTLYISAFSRVRTRRLTSYI